MTDGKSFVHAVPLLSVSLLEVLWSGLGAFCLFYCLLVLMEREEFGELCLGPTVTAFAVTLHCAEHNHGGKRYYFSLSSDILFFSYDGLDRNPVFSKLL